jgi:hypothetical protein
MTVQNKVIVDPTNPVAPDGNGGFQKIIGDQESSGQILAGPAVGRRAAGQGVRQAVDLLAVRGPTAGARGRGSIHPRPQHCSQQTSPTRTITSLTSGFAIARSKNSAGGSHVQHGAARSQQEART